MKFPRWLWIVLAVLLLGAFAWLSSHGESSLAHDHGAAHGGRSITDTGIAWPAWEDWRRTFTLSDYNTRVVFIGVTVLGAAGGLVGTFLLLRKRSLLSDTVSHSTMPGIVIAFFVGEALHVAGRSLPLLLLGATVSGVLGMIAVATIRAKSRIKDDAALALVLSVFFGLGMALLVIVQQLPTGNAAGLGRFIYGRAASMTRNDAEFILTASVVVALLCGFLFKEFKLLCFDVDYARTQGWPVVVLDLSLMGLVVAVTVIGLQAVGLLLVVALLIIPAAAARFWSHRLGVTVLLAAVIGALSGFTGVAISALFPKLPAGAVIVLAASGCFAVSFIFGAERGLWMRWMARRQMARRVQRQHLLRALYEWCETHRAPEQSEGASLEQSVPLEPLRRENHWTPADLSRLLRLGWREQLIVLDVAKTHARLSSHGRNEARQVTRNHRLWETYLLHYADVAPQHLHHNADAIEHIVDPEIVGKLEELLADREGGVVVPRAPVGSHGGGRAS